MNRIKALFLSFAFVVGLVGFLPDQAHADAGHVIYGATDCLSSLAHVSYGNRYICVDISLDQVYVVAWANSQSNSQYLESHWNAKGYLFPYDVEGGFDVPYPTRAMEWADSECNATPTDYGNTMELNLQTAWAPSYNYFYNTLRIHKYIPILYTSNYHPWYDYTIDAAGVDVISWDANVGGWRCYISP